MSANNVNDGDNTALRLAMEQLMSSGDNGTGIDLQKIVRRIAFKPRIIFFVALIVTAVAVPLIMSMKNVYEVKTLLAPVDTDKTTRLAALSSQLAGAFDPASLLLGGGGGNAKTNKALATLRSHRFITDFIRENDAKKQIYADRWDAEKGQWRTRNSILTRVFGLGPTKNDSAQEPKDVTTYNRFVKQIMNVEQDRKTGLVTMSIRFTDPKLAVIWSKALPDKLNAYYRDKERREAERSIQYLQKQIGDTGLVEMQKLLYDLIQRYTQTIMLANTTKEFIFEVIDPPYLPDRPTSPNRGLLIIVAVLLGLVAGSMASYLASIKHERKIANGGTTT